MGIFRENKGGMLGAVSGRWADGAVSWEPENETLLSVGGRSIPLRNWLWKFGAVKRKNPETQISEFCKGYWLRTPCGTAEGSQIYIVDLVQGNIRPEAVQTAETEKQDDEMRYGNYGVRPVFVLPQKN